MRQAHVNIHELLGYCMALPRERGHKDRTIQQDQATKIPAAKSHSSGSQKIGNDGDQVSIMIIHYHY